MTMRFTPEFLDRLRSLVTISTVVGKRVALKRRGREYTGLCPFHNEKTPSFTVNDEKGFYHCFGCGAHGDAIRFLTEKEGLGYVEAVERLANDVGLSLPVQTKEQAEVARKIGNYYEVVEEAACWYEAQLMGDRGGEARSYLRERGLVQSVVKRFRLGFAPSDRDGLKKHLLAKGCSEKMILEMGLIIQPDHGQSYDRFRSRLMFPILDRRGKVIAFGGRVLAGASKDAPKYLNSPETPLFHKGEVLYGMDKARRAAADARRVVVTEGYMDVIALHQAGYEYAVAPLGTAVTEGHLRLLWQMADEPIFCLDGDAAGERAMYRAAELSLAHLKPGKSLNFLMLPKGDDPDSLVRSQGGDAFAPLLEQTVSLASALWQREAAGIDQAGPEKRAAIEHRLMQLADQIADPTVKSHFRAFFRKKLWPERKKNVGNQTADTRSQGLVKYSKASDQEAWQRREADMLRLLIECPELLQDGDVEEALGCLNFSHPEMEVLRQAIIASYTESGITDAETLIATVPQIDPRHDGKKILQNLTETGNFSPKNTANDSQTSLCHWQLLLAEYDLAALKAECELLEARVAETVDEDDYNHLIEIKNQIFDRQEKTVRLRQLQAQATS